MHRETKSRVIGAQAIGRFGGNGPWVIAAGHAHDANAVNFRHAQHGGRAGNGQEPTLILVHVCVVVAPFPAQVQCVERGRADPADTHGKAVAKARGHARRNHERHFDATSDASD
jgi:hypothetical protein